MAEEFYHNAPPLVGKLLLQKEAWTQPQGPVPDSGAPSLAAKMASLKGFAPECLLIVIREGSPASRKEVQPGG